MKIALIILHADVARGGAERYTLDMAAALVKRGHDISIFASSFQKHPFAGTPVLISTTGAMTRTGRYDKFRQGVVQHFFDRTNPSSKPFDVVHAMLPFDSCDIYHPHAGIALDAIKFGHCNKPTRLKRALAWIGNRTNRRRLKFASVEKQMLTNRPVVLCLSNLIKEVVHREYPTLPLENLVSLFNGIDIQKFDPSIRPETRRQVRAEFQIEESTVVGLMLAQDFERKGLAQAIKALARVENSKMVLLIGGKPDPTAYRQLADELGVKDRVIFAGPVSDPVSFYQAADFFVLPTRFDPCSLVVLEALAMGLPVISTIKNGACEIMRDVIHGSVLPDPDDIPSLATAMTGMSDPLNRKTMSIACLSLRPALSQDAHLDRLQQVYEEIATKRKAANVDLAHR